MNRPMSFFDLLWEHVQQILASARVVVNPGVDYMVDKTLLRVAQPGRDVLQFIVNVGVDLETHLVDDLALWSRQVGHKLRLDLIAGVEEGASCSQQGRIAVLERAGDQNCSRQAVGCPSLFGTLSPAKAVLAWARHEAIVGPSRELGNLHLQPSVRAARDNFLSCQILGRDEGFLVHSPSLTS